MWDAQMVALADSARAGCDAGPGVEITAFDDVSFSEQCHDELKKAVSPDTLTFPSKGDQVTSPGKCLREIDLVVSRSHSDGTHNRAHLRAVHDELEISKGRKRRYTVHTRITSSTWPLRHPHRVPVVYVELEERRPPVELEDGDESGIVTVGPHEPAPGHAAPSVPLRRKLRLISWTAHE